MLLSFNRRQTSRLLLCPLACLVVAGASQFPAAAAASRDNDAAAVHYSTASLASVMARIQTAEPWARVARATLSEWYVDSQADRVVVGLTKVTSPARIAAFDTFGAEVDLTAAPVATIAVIYARVSHIHHLSALDAASDSSSRSRINDESPLYGGDAIVSYVGLPSGAIDVAECTTSFDSESTAPRHNVMLTAGHCEEPMFAGEDWYNGYVKGKTVYLGLATIGKVANISTSPDAMTITKNAKSGTYSPHVYVGSATSSSSYPVVGTKSVTKGMHICTDGEVTGAQICGPRVTHTGVCLRIQLPGVKVTVCDLAEASYSRAFCHEGDSGGPVYSDLGKKKIYALGTIEATVKGENVCYFTMLSSILPILSIKVNTTK